MDHGLAALVAADPALAPVAEATGPVRLRRREAGFAALLSAIVSQQVSVASARAIWARLEGAGLTERSAVARAEEDALRACGLSRQKIRYALALAQSGVDFDRLHGMDDAGIVATLTAVPGIGVWTAEIYAMFALGRADIFPAGDLALQEGARLALDLPERPRERALRARAEAWAPWRSVAAKLLWQYYALVKEREGVNSR
ncbi:DNA-3-methyladenine glycosylase 2 family protein [Halovulum dunhuangense]|uniref:DNA-3-methyladenine glycosylase II n=2 Tax=Halovulum dunhuangense TaxID=1505036 RepID=A0A849L3Y3_9RHOB|nr:DNA-3-methyladenine glycosylase 2 family protein [Halovulum dunhuangense]NNU80963.1 DNA-3-methyladenine glycosylase 2 family protein [Halovulum dunhuangense]